MNQKMTRDVGLKNVYKIIMLTPTSKGIFDRKNYWFNNSEIASLKRLIMYFSASTCVLNFSFVSSILS